MGPAHSVEVMMATRKDLLKAQSFTSRRMIAAFVDRDPDDPTPPLRRVVTATFVSVLIGVILLAGSAIFGLVRPGGSQAWREEGIVISDTTSGVQFVYLDEQLVPMANTTSARLMAAYHNEGEEPRTVNVRTDSLKGTPQNQLHGIPGAPRQLPDASSMDVYPLTMCSAAPTSMGDRYLTLEFGASPPPETEPFAFVARAPNDDEYLIMNGRAHRMWREQGNASPLIEDLPIVRTGTAWLSAIPVGPVLEPLDIPNVGERPANDALGMYIGQLAVVEGSEGGSNRYYIQLDQGLAQISYLDMRLQTTARGENEPRRISENDLAAARNETVTNVSNPNMPLDRPQRPVGQDNLETISVCATYTRDDPSRVTLSLNQPTPEIPTEQNRPNGNRLDVVAADTLSGGLFRNAANDADDAVTFLVTGGRMYPIPDLASRTALGYGDVDPAPVPGQLLALFEPGLERDQNLSMEFVRPMAANEN